VMISLEERKKAEGPDDIPSKKEGQKASSGRMSQGEKSLKVRKSGGAI